MLHERIFLLLQMFACRLDAYTSIFSAMWSRFFGVHCRMRRDMQTQLTCIQDANVYTVVQQSKHTVCRAMHCYAHSVLGLLQTCTQSCNNPSTLCAVLCIAMHSVLGLLQMCTQSCNDPSTLCAVHSNACVPSASTTNAPTDIEQR